MNPQKLVLSISATAFRQWLIQGLRVVQSTECFIISPDASVGERPTQHTDNEDPILYIDLLSKYTDPLMNGTELLVLLDDIERISLATPALTEEWKVRMKNQDEGWLPFSYFLGVSPGFVPLLSPFMNNREDVHCDNDARTDEETLKELPAETNTGNTGQSGLPESDAPVETTAASSDAPVESIPEPPDADTTAPPDDSGADNAVPPDAPDPDTAAPSDASVSTSDDNTGAKNSDSQKQETEQQPLEQQILEQQGLWNDDHNRSTP